MEQHLNNHNKLTNLPQIAAQGKIEHRLMSLYIAYSLYLWPGGSTVYFLPDP